MAAWHYQKDGQQHGPVTSQHLKELAASGHLLPTDLIWKEGMAGWVPASKLKGLFVKGPPQAPPLPARTAPHSIPHDPAISTSGSSGRPLSVYLMFAAVGGVTAIVLMLAMVFTFTSGDADSPSLTNDGDESPSSQSVVADRSNREPPPTDSSTARGAVGLPKELTPSTDVDRRPLSALQLFAASISGSSDDGPFVQFSPTGRYALLLYRDGRRHEVHLWNCHADSVVEVGTNGGKGLSFPVAFSPDDARIASIDGDTLRIWNLEKNSAQLAQSVSLAPPPKLTSRVDWTGLRWTSHSLVASHRSAHRNFHFHILKINPDSVEVGVSKGFRHTDGGDFETFDAIVSPNGQFLLRVARSWDDANLNLLASDLESGGELPPVALPAADLDYAHYTTASAASFGRIGPSSHPDSEQPTCMLVAPNSRLIALSLREKGTNRPLAILIDIETRRIVARLSPEYVDDGGSKPRRVTDLLSSTRSSAFVRCFSPDSKFVIGTEVERSGESTTRWVVVWDAATGERLRQFDASTAYPAHDDDVAYTPDGRFVVIADLFDADWNESESRQERMFRVLGWDQDGRPIAPAFGRIGSMHASQSLSLSPDMLTLVTSHGGMLRVWDVDRLGQLHMHVALGDRAWESGDSAKAFEHYQLVFQDAWSWDLEFFVEDEFPRMLSRCIDAYGATEETAKGIGLARFAIEKGFNVSPETSQGQTALRTVVAEIETEQKLRQEQRDKSSFDRGYREGHQIGSAMGKAYREAASEAARQSIMDNYKGILDGMTGSVEQMVKFNGQDSPAAQYHLGRHQGAIQGFADVMRQ